MHHMLSPPMSVYYRKVWSVDRMGVPLGTHKNISLNTTRRLVRPDPLATTVSKEGCCRWVSQLRAMLWFAIEQSSCQLTCRTVAEEDPVVCYETVSQWNAVYICTGDRCVMSTSKSVLSARRYILCLHKSVLVAGRVALSVRKFCTLYIVSIRDIWRQVDYWVQCLFWAVASISFLNPSLLSINNASFIRIPCKFYGKEPHTHILPIMHPLSQFVLILSALQKSTSSVITYSSSLS